MRGALPVTFPQCHTKEKEKSVISLSYLILLPNHLHFPNSGEKRNNQAIILIRDPFSPFLFGLAAQTNQRHFSTNCCVSTERETVISLTNISFPHLGRKKGRKIYRPTQFVGFRDIFLVTFFCWGKCPSSVGSFVRERLCCCFLLFLYAGKRDRRRNHISHYSPKMRTNNTDLPLFQAKKFFNNIYVSANYKIFN